MPTEDSKKAVRGTMDELKRVAPNLYRNESTGDYYGRRKVAGKRRLHKLGTKDRKLADRQLAKWMGKVAATNIDAGKMTLAQLLAQFEDMRAPKGKNTKATDTGIIKQFKLHFDITRRAHSIRPPELNVWMAKMDERDLEHSTYNRYAHFLGQLFELAVALGVFVESPYVQAKIKWKRISRQLPTLPTYDEFKAIVHTIRLNPHNADAQDSADFVEFLGCAALGQAEARFLTISDLDFKEGDIRTLRIKTQTYFKVPMYPRVRPLLDRIAARMKKNKITDPKTPVFKILDGKKALTNAISRINHWLTSERLPVYKARGGVAKIKDELGGFAYLTKWLQDRPADQPLPHFSQRNLRQMAVKHLVRSGVDVQLIADWQAHRDGGKLILDTYSQGEDAVDAEYRRSQLEKLKEAV